MTQLPELAFSPRLPTRTGTGLCRNGCCSGGMIIIGASIPAVPANTSPVVFDREPHKSTPGVRKAWNAVTTRDSSSSYRQLDEHTNRVAINSRTFVMIFSVASFRP